MAAKAKLKACPVLKFTVSHDIARDFHGKGDGGTVNVDVHTPSRIAKVGQITVDVYGFRETIAQVGWIHVDPAFRRCNVGTQLYEHAARATCQIFKTPLSSDRQRSGTSQAFWAKQVAKGRAICVEPSRAPAHREDAAFTDPVHNRAGCSYYQLKRCGIRSLRGARRRR